MIIPGKYGGDGEGGAKGDGPSSTYIHEVVATNRKDLEVLTKGKRLIGI